jgi:hypothetical protein
MLLTRKVGLRPREDLEPRKSHIHTDTNDFVWAVLVRVLLLRWSEENRERAIASRIPSTALHERAV